MAFDGTDFVGLDEDCLGNGDADTLPLDAFLQQRIRGNQYYLAQGRNAVTCTFRQGTDAETAKSAEDRPWASLRKSYPVCIPWRMSQGLDGMRLSGLWYVGGEGLENNDLDYWLSLRDPGRRELGSVNGSLAQDTAFELNDITLSLSQPYVGDAGYGMALFGIRSQDDGDTGNNVALNSNAFSMTSQANGDLPSTAYYRAWLSRDSDGQGIDFFGVDSNGSKEEVAFGWPTNVANAIAGVTPIYSIRHLTYMMARSIELEPTYGPDSITPIGLDSLAAKQPVLGRRAIEQAQHSNTLYRRPRCLAWGPAGDRYSNQQSSWPSTFHQRWPIADGDPTTPQTLIDTPVIVDSDSPVIEFAMFVIPTIAVFGQPGAQRVLQQGEIDWEFVATVEGFDTADASWSTPTSYGTTTRTQTTKIYGMGPFTPFLHSKGILHDYYSAQGLFEPTAAGTQDDWQFAFREGQLFDGDLPLIQQVTIRVSTSSLTSLEVPLRLKLTAEHDVGSLTFEPGITNPSATGIYDWIHCTCVGWSIWQVPEVTL